MAEIYPQYFQSLFGGDTNYFRANSPWNLVEQNAGAIRGRTFIRIDFGDKDLDWRQEKNREMHQLLDRLGIAHEYESVPGVGHSFLQIYQKLGDKLWAFYRNAFVKT